MERSHQAISGFRRQTNKPIRPQIEAYLRDEIGSGRLGVGQKLATTQQLAAAWETQPATVHAAMTTLVKEGLLHRARNSGTFVAERSKGLKRVGIYLRRDIWCEPAAVFARTLVSQISKRLEEEGVEAEILVDARTSEIRWNSPMPELVRAAKERRIQALLMPDTVTEERHWLSRLPIPWVEWSSEPIPNRVSYSPGEMECMAVRELARMGCRSAGLITPYNLGPGDTSRDMLGRASVLAFRETCAELGLSARAEWMADPSQAPAVPEAEAEQFGYKAMRRILAMPDRPEGVFVKHDWIARGALTAVLESKVAVPEELKLVFFRNQEVPWICPVPAGFVEASITQVAEQMIRIMHAQLGGEDYEPGVRTVRMVPASGDEIPAKLAEMVETADRAVPTVG